VVINRLTTGNTFQQWVLTTQRISTDLNRIVDGTIANVYSNTNIDVDNNLHVNGNVLVTGTFILDEIDFDDLRVEGNLSVNNAITAGNAEFGNLVVSSNIQTLNVTTDLVFNGNLDVSQKIYANNFIAKNLTVTNNFDINDTRVIGRNIQATELEVLGNLSATQNTVLNIATVDYLNGQNVTITLLTGDGKDQIYETVNNSTAYITVRDNVSAFLGFAIALS
jgi:cytoskeletal protein CcmA (bactofilin family)